MNNLSSYCWLTDSRMSASEKDLPLLKPKIQARTKPCLPWRPWYRRRRRTAAACHITTCPPSFRQPLTPLLNVSTNLELCNRFCTSLQLANPMLLVLVMTINPSNIACNNLVGCVIKLRPNCLLIREPIKRGKDPQMCHKNKFFSRALALSQTQNAAV